jgi:acetyl esterase/lipase
VSAVAPARTTYRYREVDGCGIHADVIGATPRRARACVVWIHGGGLIFGSRAVSPRPSLVDAFLDEDLVVVSLDHRLAPETKLAAIVDDLRAAWSWLRESGAAIGIDPERIALAGASSGAYLALIGGYALEPKPRAIGSFWGFGDITAPWEAEPSAHYRSTYPVATRERALASVGEVAVSDPPSDSERDWFYLYCRQQGRWLVEVTGHEPRDNPDWFTPYLPIRNITGEYPPTLLVHGTDDNDVPHEESRRLDERLRQCGVPHEFLSLEGVGHGFAGASPERIAEVERALARFAARSLRRPP